MYTDTLRILYIFGDNYTIQTLKTVRFYSTTKFLLTSNDKRGILNETFFDGFPFPPPLSTKTNHVELNKRSHANRYRETRYIDLMSE